MRQTLATGVAFWMLSPALAVAVGIWGGAQDRPEFRTTVDLVELDVSVLGRDRRPVRGLRASDFSVFEDGRPQEVSFFEAVDVPDRPDPVAAWANEVLPDVVTNRTAASRFWVFILDDALIKKTPYLINQSRAIAIELIRKLGPSDVAALVFTADSRRAQDFTNNHAALLSALEEYSPGWAGAGTVDPTNAVNPDWQFELGSVMTIRNVVETLGAIPRVHKSIVWVTPGVEQSLLYEATQVPRPSAAGPTQARKSVQLDIIDKTKEIFVAARKANVAIYPIDPTGLVSPRGAETRLDYLLTTASNTGGHAIILTNDPVAGVEQVYAENSSYYVLGYYPSDTEPRRTARRIQVKVNRDDVDVRTRSTYDSTSAKAEAPRSTGQILTAAILSSVPVRDLPLAVSVAPVAIAGQRNAAVTIAFGVREPIPESSGGRRLTLATDLRASAYTTEGNLRASQDRQARVIVRADARGEAEYEALSRIDLPPGRYRLRLAAHQDLGGKTGSVMVDVEVPDFSREPASVSGVIVDVQPSVPSAPRDLFQQLLPIIPTARRDFERTDKATTLCYLYQNAGKKMVPADVTIRLRDSHGVLIVTESRHISVQSFAPVQTAARIPAAIQALYSVPLLYGIPISNLNDGAYLLSFEIQIGLLNARRDVQFNLR